MLDCLTETPYQRSPQARLEPGLPIVKVPNKVTEITRKKKPVVITVEKLKEPFFRPLLRGVRKQLNPLSKAADVWVAPAPLPLLTAQLVNAPLLGQNGLERGKRGVADH